MPKNLSEMLNFQQKNDFMVKSQFNEHLKITDQHSFNGNLFVQIKLIKISNPIQDKDFICNRYFSSKKT